MRNKFLGLFLCVLFIMSFSIGCGNKAGDSDVVPNPTNTVAPTETQMPVLTEAATATPMIEPTVTITPTSEPTPTDAPEATATPTPTCTPMPTCTPEPTAISTPTPEQTAGYTVTDMEPKDMWATTDVNMRTLPSTDGERILVVKNGKKVVVTGQCNETNWYRVEYNAQSGYISNKYLTDVMPTPTPTQIPKPTPIPKVYEPTGDNTIVIRMVGDALIHNAIYRQGKKSDGTYNSDKLFANVKSVIQEADIAIINQETILVANEADYSHYPNFGSPYAIGQGALDAGFDIIAHATNHTLDKGISGVRQTLDFWRDKDVTVLGIHDSEQESDIDYVSCEGITISFVNYTYGLNGHEPRIADDEYIVDLLSDPYIENTVATAKATSDLMIAILHVGTEYVYTPSNEHIKQVDRFIDAGADIVLCAHPHVVETYGMRTTENNNTALVYYSLGNFISYQNKVPRMIGGMADITIGLTPQDDSSYKVEIVDYDMVPIVTHLQGGGNISTYFMSEYTDALCAKHVYFKDESLKVSDLYELYDKMVNEAAHLVD
ncbi:MAG: CapA family protein [Lachnospiraceae bacterium]|nr:CapA family protein [Lachnospiraceae bacterium]